LFSVPRDSECAEEIFVTLERHAVVRLDVLSRANLRRRGRALDVEKNLPISDGSDGEGISSIHRPTGRACHGRNAPEGSDGVENRSVIDTLNPVAGSGRSGPQDEEEEG
jgi:hypothetical protein